MESASEPGLRVAFVILAALVVIFFSPWLVQGKVLAPLDIVEQMLLPWRGEQAAPRVHNHFVSDAVTQYLPYRMLAAASFAADGYVGWNPLVFGGVPQSSNTMALNADWSTQLFRVLDFWTAWHVGRMAQFLVAGVGMLVFLRSRGCGGWIAPTFSAAYMLNTEFVGWIYHQWALASFCWMPWVLWAWHAACDKGARFAGLAAVFLALALLGATLQHAAFVVTALACVWAGRLVGRPRSLGSGTATVVTIGVLGAGLAAFALEPSMHSYFENLRAGHLREGLGYADGLRQPVMTALAWPFTVYPFALGSVQTLDLSKAFVSSGVAFGFFGSVPVVLAVAGLFSRRVPPAAKLLVAAGVLLPLTPLVGVLYQRVNLLWILGGCWCAASWLAGVGQNELKSFVRRAWQVTAVVAALWLAASVVLLAGRGWWEELLLAKVQGASANGQFGRFTDWMEGRAAGLIDHLAIWNPWQLVALGGAVLSIWGLPRIKVHTAWPGAAVMVGVCLQLSVFWWQWTTWSSDRGVYGEPPLVQVLKAEVGDTGRLAQIPGAPAEVYFPPNTLVPSAVAITGGYDSIHPDGMRSRSGAVWDFPGTTHFLGRVGEEGPEDWPEAWTDGLWVLQRNPAPTMGTFSTRAGEGLPLLPKDVRRVTLNTLEILVPTGAERVEVFMNWHRGWKWRGNTEDGWRSSSAGPTKGIEIELGRPAGTAEVLQLRFEPAAADWARAVTLLSAISVACLLLPWVRRARCSVPRVRKP